MIFIKKHKKKKKIIIIIIIQNFGNQSNTCQKKIKSNSCHVRSILEKQIVGLFSKKKV